MLLVGDPSGGSAHPTTATSGVRARALAAVAASPASVGLIVSPQPDTPDASPDTQISLLGPPAREIGSVVVTGSRSGLHRGSLEAYSTGDGASFLPAVGFQPGERVSVHAKIGTGHSAREIAFAFTVAVPASIPASIHHAPAHGSPVTKGQVQSFHSRLDLHPPTLTVTTHGQQEAPGDVFIAPVGQAGQHGPMIIDGSGNLIYFHPVGRDIAMDFKVQSDDGRPVLTWWQGVVSPPGFGLGEHVILDSSYRRIATVRAGNGYQADLHDFQITPQGTALMTAYSPVLSDLSSLHGAKHGLVLDSIVQEVDIKTGLVMFEWHALGHIALDESYARVPRTYYPFDYFHVNSIQLEHDGNLLISARNTWAAYEVSMATGGIVWRLGGKRSSFAMGPGARFYWQHDVRSQSVGTVSLFDDGAAPVEEKQSRAEVLRLDMTHHTATVLRQYAHPQPLLAFSQGNTQPLPDGDTFVGWGQVNYLSEFDPAGELVFDAHLPGADDSYRAFRFPWTGTPHDAPNAAVAPAGAGGLTVYASWNGATDVASWQALAGSSTDTATMSVVGSSHRTGFETAMEVPAGAPHLAVRALDAGGHVIGESPAIKP